MSATADYEEEDEDPRMSRRRLLFLIGIIVVGIIGLLVFVQYSAYEHQVVNTTLETGSIASIKADTVSVNGLNNNNGQINGANAAQVESISTSLVNVTLGSSSFSVSLPCSPTPYRAGQSVNIDDNTLRNGAHTYVADLACKGQKISFVNVSTSTKSTSA
jgi:hypothetical protein